MSNRPDFQLFVPESMPQSVGYSQLARVNQGSLLFIAGQVALDRAGNVVGKDDVRLQLRQIFENLKAALAAAGGTFDEVIRLNSYFLDVAHLPVFREVRDQYVSLERPPASTAIQVGKLFRPEFLAEVEAIAVVRQDS